MTTAPATELALNAVETEAIPGGIGDDQEEAVLNSLNDWLSAQSLPEGRMEHELAHPDTGEPLAILDLAWPNGLHEGFSDPVALLLGEEQQTLQIANDYGFRHFTNAEAFKRYVEAAVLASAVDGSESA